MSETRFRMFTAEDLGWWMGELTSAYERTGRELGQARRAKQMLEAERLVDRQTFILNEIEALLAESGRRTALAERI